MASVQRGRLDELERSSEGEDDEHFVGETGSGETIARLGLTHSHSDTLRSEEHTSELQSLMRIPYAVFCLKKTKTTLTTTPMLLSRFGFLRTRSLPSSTG